MALYRKPPPFWSGQENYSFGVFRESDHPRATDGRFGNKAGDRKTSQQGHDEHIKGEESKMAGNEVQTKKYIANLEDNLKDKSLYPPGSTAEKKLVAKINKLKKSVGGEGDLKPSNIKSEIDSIAATLAMDRGKMDPSVRRVMEQKLAKLKEELTGGMPQKIDASELKESIQRVEELQQQLKDNDPFAQKYVPATPANPKHLMGG